jgi:alanine racemase
LAKIKVGDPVILISKEKTDANSALEIAKLCETIPYEILVHIPQHLRRTVVF